MLLLFHGLRHPRDIVAAGVTVFPRHLANERKVSVATQSQAKSAFYKQVLGIDLPWFDEIVPAKRDTRLPVIVGLLYGAGMCLLECLCLRVKDVQLTRYEILIREGQGQQGSLLPENLVLPLQKHLARVKAVHDADLAAGFGEVSARWTGA